MTSIRRQLFIRLLPPLLLLVVVSVAGLFIYVRHVLTRDFDATITARANAVIEGSYWDDDHHGILASPDSAVGEFSLQPRPEYFSVWRTDGKLMTQSQSLRGTSLPSGGPASIWNLKLPDGRDGRAVRIFFGASRDVDDLWISTNPADPSRQMVIVFAMGTETLDAPLAVLFTSLLSLAAIFVLGTMIALALAVHRSLEPLARIARKAAEDASPALSHRFPTSGMPAEVSPICDCLNKLLDSLSSAFSRERRFTSDAAHELRTPIAELRSMTEVALRWPDDAAHTREVIADSLAIAQQMQSIVATLLSLARCETNAHHLSVRPVGVADLIRKAWKPLIEVAGHRQLNVQFDLQADLAVQTDPALLQSIIANLLSNAASHCIQGGHVSCAVLKRAEAVVLEVSNDAPSLSPDDLKQMFEPFWRKDKTRTGQDHSGLGLTLAASYAKLLGAQLSAAMPRPGWLTLTLQFTTDANPAAPASPWKADPAEVSPSK